MKPYISELEGRERLADIGLEPGSKVFVDLRHRARSGMTRYLSVFLPVIDGKDVLMADISMSVAAVCHLTVREDHSIRVQGAGMDMGFWLVYDLGWRLYPNGFGCVGEGCNSNDHSNGLREYGEGIHHGDGGYALRFQWL